jgi:2-amino-4-hydroxy-6-hydroxymethyldihydropteridine diphosphokinase
VSIAYVGLGSNLGAPVDRLQSALRAMGQLPATRVVTCSSLYRSEPQGYRDQPDFVNAVAELETGSDARTLLSGLQVIEQRAGRERSFPNAPRTLDLDLLLYDGQRIDAPGLTVPHPRMQERAFVLVPLLEIAPAITIPGVGPARACLERLGAQRLERLS